MLAAMIWTTERSADGGACIVEEENSASPHDQNVQFPEAMPSRRLRGKAHTTDPAFNVRFESLAGMCTATDYVRLSATDLRFNEYAP